MIYPNRLREISIEITHECPLQCNYCSSEASYPSPIKDEINFGDISKILIDGKELNTEIISISGGEPLQREETVKSILKQARNLEYEILLYTCGIQKKNGVIQEINSDLLAFLQAFADYKFKIIFNLQGHSESIVEKINNSPGSFQFIEKSIIKCIENGIICETHFVPFKCNISYIENIIEYTKRLGIRKISFLRFVEQGRALNKYLNITSDEFFELQKFLDKQVNRKDIDIRIGHPINFLFLVNKDRDIVSCPGEYESVLIYPNGEVHLCPAWKNFKHLIAGNIKNKSIIDIWRKSEYFMKFRKFINEDYKKIKGFCSNCVYLDKCKGRCSAQRIIPVFLKNLPINFPECLYFSPDPICPIYLKKVE